MLRQEGETAVRAFCRKMRAKPASIFNVRDAISTAIILADFDRDKVRWVNSVQRSASDTPFSFAVEVPPAFRVAPHCVSQMRYASAESEIGPYKWPDDRPLT